MGSNSTKEIEFVPEDRAVIEIWSWNLTLIENVVLKGKEVKSSGPQLHALISSKSKMIKSKKYVLLRPEVTVLRIKPDDSTSEKRLVPLHSKDLLDLSGRKCFIILEKNYPKPSKPLNLGEKRHFHVNMSPQEVDANGIRLY